MHRRREQGQAREHSEPAWLCLCQTQGLCSGVRPSLRPPWRPQPNPLGLHRTNLTVNPWGRRSRPAAWPGASLDSGAPHPPDSVGAEWLCLQCRARSGEN